MKLSHIWVAVMLVLAVGCQTDPMQEGRAALATENADAAEVAFKKALAADPESAEAQRMLAEVMRLRGKFVEAEKQLNMIWDKRGFVNGGRARAPEDELLRRLLKEQYADLYKEWLSNVDPHEDSDTFIDAVRRGIEKDPKNENLNALAVKFHMARAERFLETGTPGQAAGEYAEALMYQPPAEKRLEAETKLYEFRNSAYRAALTKHFEANVKPGFIEAGRWDEERDAVRLQAENQFDHKIDVNNKASLGSARATSEPVIERALINGINAVTGTEIDKDVMAAFGRPKYTVESETIKGKKITFELLLTFDAAAEYGFKLTEAGGPTPSGPKSPTVRSVEVDVGKDSVAPPNPKK